MAIPSQQIGWTQDAKLLWQISKQLEQLISVTYNTSLPNPLLNILNQNASAQTANLWISGSAKAGTFNGLTITNNGTNVLNIAAGQSLIVPTGGTLGSAAYTASTAYEVPLTFSDGLIRTVNAIKNTLITGLAGGQTIYGGTLTAQTLSIRSNVADLTTGSVRFLDSLEASSSTVGAVTMAGGLAIAKRLYALDMTVTNTISGSITGNAGTVSNLTLTTALTNNGGIGTLTWPVGGATLTIPTGGGTAEVISNKATTFGIVNDTLYPTVKAVNDAIISAVVGLLDYRGSYDASTNLFPATGGSGTAGAVLKGDFWIVSVAGTLGGVAVTANDLVIALIDTPAQTASNWTLQEHTLSYTPENITNKVTSISVSSTDVQYPSAKLLYDQLLGKATAFSGTINEIAYFNSASTIASLAIITYPSLTELSYIKGLTSAIQSQLNGKQGTLTNSAGLSTAIGGDLAVVDGGTGTSTGSITGTGALVYTAGGSDQNVTLTPSGTGYTILNGNIGIGINIPTQKTHIVGTNGLPATSGSSADGILRLQPSGSAAGLDFGSIGGESWIQARYLTDYAINYTLLLNPNGGPVGIGVTSSTAVLHLKAGTAAANTAPCKFSAGVLLTTPELGTLEFTDDGTTAHIYGTVRIATTVTRVQII